MKRNRSLIPLTHDHHHVLAMVKKSRAALKTEEGSGKAVDDLTEFYETEMINQAELLELIDGHVRLEEKTLFPLVEQRQPFELEMVVLAPRDRSASGMRR